MSDLHNLLNIHGFKKNFQLCIWYSFCIIFLFESMIKKRCYRMKFIIVKKKLVIYAKRLNLNETKLDFFSLETCEL